MKKPVLYIVATVCLWLAGCGQRNASMQPFEVDKLFSNKDEVLNHLRDKCVDTISFKKGDVVADIGSGNGSVVIMLSMFHDSITFYIQDIDPLVCNQEKINSLIGYYEGLNEESFTSRFFIATGSDTETNLPDNTFDKILMLWTYQYFKDPQAIMTDIKQKLKDDGIMYIVNPDLEKANGEKLTLKFGWNASTVEREISDIIDCGFELISISRNYESPEHPYIMVFKKKLTGPESDV